MYDSGIYLHYCDGANVVEDNTIYAPDMTYGIYLNYCQSTSGNEATIANNLISVEDQGIYLYYYNYYQNIYYNSVKVRDSYALYTSYYNNNNTLKNNILLTESASTPAAYFYNTAVFTSSDYNDFYSSFAYPISYSGNKTLAQWQAYGQDSSSVSIDPYFDADSSLVPTSYILDNLGTPIAGITDDINGNTRSETTPDMGAMEFTVTGSALAGSYTVGSGGDYDSISTALNDLSIYGISGPITFNILPGVYTEQSTIGEIYGTSATNTLTIQSSTGDTADVSWQYTPTSSANYILKVNGTDHLTIKNIGFDVSASSSYGTILDISGETDSLKIEGNEFRGYDYTSNSSNHYLVESTSNTGTGMVFTDNTFLQGSVGIFLNNGAADDGELKISNNTCNGQYQGIYVAYVDSVEISGNTIAGGHGGSGIYVYSCKPAIVTGNKVTEFTENQLNYGIYLYDSDGNSSGERTVVANNMIKAYVHAIYLYYSNYSDIYYNTLINTYPNAGTSYGTLALQNTSYTNIKNNIITNTSGGRLIIKLTSYPDMYFDYNMYYGGSASNGFYSNNNPSVNGDFEDWQAAGLDSNGVLQDPEFYSFGDGFHLGAGNSLGTPLTEVTIDFDNEPRDETIPDIGADEYISPNYDGVVEVPGEITTIQGAIDIAVSGDSIKVAAGTYVENIDFSGKNIVVIGADRETTIIDGDSSGSVVKFISGEDSTAVLMGFTITNGAAENGGGIHLDQSSPSLYDLTVSQNTASSSGGGIYCYDQSSPILKNSSVVNNSSGELAGGIRCWIDSNIKLENVVIANNTAAQTGGGMHCWNNSSPTLMNVTMINNNAGNAGGIFLRGSNPIIVNSIVWGNTPQNIEFRGGINQGNITFSYSDLQGGQDSIVTDDGSTVTWGDGNIDLDPLFMDADSGNYHLSDLSPTISAGTDTITIAGVLYTAPTTDLDGNPRPNPAGTVLDMGAYENENGAGVYNGPVWYVDASSDLPYANGSISAKFSKIQYGINAAVSADTVLVAAGTYVENIDFSGKNIVVIGADQETTIIDGNQAGSVVTFQSGELPNAVLRGFTLQNGLEANGGGIYCTDGSSPSLYDLIITNNSATGNNGRGGGLRCTINSDPTLVNVLISDNTATQEGGGIFCNNSDPSFVNVTVGGNVSSIADGGGLFIQNNSNVNLLNTIIASNDSNDLEFSSTGDSSTITLLYSNIDGGQDSIITNDNGTVIWGDGSLDTDPLFVDADNDDFNLTADSRCIDTGHPDSTDADGTVADMGAYYYDQSGQPVRVSNLITTPSADNVSVKWNANSAAASYNIYRSTDVSADFYSLSSYSTASDASYLDESVDDNTTYHYRVSAVDSDGDEGIFAFARHGRTGNDTTALAMGADDRWISVSQFHAPVINADQDYTLEFYFHPLAYQNAVAKIMRLSGLSVYLVTAPQDSFQIRVVDEDGSVFDGDIIVQDSSWHHLAVTAPAGGNLSLWLDGHFNGEAGADIALSSSGVDFNSSDPANSFDGILDEVRFSNSLRYSASFVPPGQFIVDNNTLALWRMNEGSFDENFPAIYDWGGNGYHGLVSSSTNPDWVSGSPIQPEGQPAFVINELMPNPNGSDGGREWIELYNNYYTPLSLQDWIISGSGSGETVTLSFDRTIPTGGYALLAQDGDNTANGGIDPDIVYGTGVSFGNNQETVFIKDVSGAVVDSLAYTTEFPYSSGVSMELIVPQWDNNDTLSWVAAGMPYGDGDNLGSPGRKNDSYSGIVQSSIVEHDFSYITQGESESISFWIGNIGVTELNVSQISTLTEAFTVDPSQSMISVGDSAEIEIQFSPTDIGEYTDTVSIVSDDPYNPVVTIVVSGTAINEYADIVVSYGENDSISFFNFPFTRVNDTRLDTLLITNAGTPDLEIEEIFIEGDGFSTSVESGLVPFMDTLLIPITFAPEAEGTYSASLVINCPNDLDETTYTIQLNGQASNHIILLVPEVYATIQSAINAAYLEDTVQVSPGTYEELLHFGEKNLVLRSEMGPLETFIEGDGSGSVLTIAGGQTNITQVMGFTITGGGGTDGGGLRIDSSSSPLINDMIIVENSADEGAGVHIKNSSPVFGHVVIKNNESVGDGGGIAVRDNSSPVFNNLTLADNVSQSDGGAIYIRNGSNTQLTNSILWNNGTESIYISSTGSASQITVDYSIVDGGAAGIAANGSTVNWGTGNLEDDPLFGNLFSLQWGSPAIDAGDPAVAPDLDGTITDMGALYYDQTYQPPNPPVGLSYVPGSGEITLSWTANEEIDLTHYVVYRGSAPDALDFLAVVTAPTAEYVDTALDPSMINYYALTAVDTASLASDTTAVLTVSFPTLSTSDDVLSFGDIRVGITETMQVTLSNTGSDTLFVDSIYVADDLSGFSVALGEMNTSSSLIERIAISKSRSRVTPYDRSGSKGRKSGRAGLSSKDKSSSQPRSLNNNTDPKTASIPVRPGSFSPGKSPVSIGKQFNQLTANSVLTISTEVMPGESIGLDVSFMRVDTLTVADELRITSDDPLGNDVVSIGLSGRSVAPVLVLAADTLDFGNILSGSQLTVMVSNDGTDTLNVSAMAFPSGFTGSLADSTLLPGETAQLTVSITPEDNGYWTGDVLLTSDSYLQSEHSVALSALSMNATLGS